MATTFPTYPATSYEQAVDLTIFSSNQLGDVINSDAVTEIETENGNIPSLRKALVDNFFFKDPIDWEQGTNETVFNQLRFFSNGVLSAYYYAPTATTANPVPMGSSPSGDANWVLYAMQQETVASDVYPWLFENAVGDETVISPPYVFDSAIVTINGIVQVLNKAYTISNSQIILNEPLGTDPSTGEANTLFAYIGKVTASSDDYVQTAFLTSSSGADSVGVSQGGTVQDQIDELLTSVSNKANIADLESNSSNLGASLIGLEQGGTVQQAVNWITPLVADSDTTHDTAINNAITLAKSSGRKVVFDPSVAYNVAGSINVELSEGDNLQIDFNGATITTPGSTSLFLFQNTLQRSAVAVSAVTEVSYDLSAGASVSSRVSQIYAPGHGFTQVGDVGRIFSDDLVADSDASNQFRAEWFVIAAIDGDYIYTTGVLIETYSTGVYVCQPSTAKLDIANLNVKSEWVSGYSASAVTVRGFIRPFLRGVLEGQDLNGPFVNVTCCYMATGDTISPVRLKNDTDTASYGYGFNDSASFGTYVNLIKGQYTRHPMTTSTPGASGGVVAGDLRWDLRGRTMFFNVATAMVQGDACTIDFHASNYKCNIGKIIALDSYRGDGAGGVGVQLRGNSTRIDSIECVNPKTGLFISGASKTSESYISIGHLRCETKQGCLPLNIQGSENYRVKVVIDNLEFTTEHDSLIYVKNVKLIVKYLSGEFNPYANGAELFEIDTGGVIDVLDGDVYINTGNTHRLAVHDATGTVCRARLRVTGGALVSYLAASASQYDIQSEWEVHIDAWTGTPFLGLPTTGAKAFAKLRVGSTSYPLRYRALSYTAEGSYAIDLSNTGDQVVFLRVNATATDVIISSLTKGAFPGQLLIINNHTASTASITLSNSTAGFMTLGAAVTIAVGAGVSLVWDGATWRRAS